MQESGLSADCGRMSLSVPCRPFCFRHSPSRGHPLRAASSLPQKKEGKKKTFLDLPVIKAVSSTDVELDGEMYVHNKKMRQRQTILDYTGVARATSACEPIRIPPRTMKSGCKLRLGLTASQWYLHEREKWRTGVKIRSAYRGRHFSRADPNEHILRLDGTVRARAHVRLIADDQTRRAERST